MRGNSAISQLTLGTVQLGSAYGQIVHHTAPSATRALAILDAAWDSGITSFDTAPSYGQAEARLGAWLKKQGRRPFIISKMPRLESDDTSTEIVSALTSSLKMLGAQSLMAWLVHRPSDLWRNGVLGKLRELVERDQIGGFGVSVYTPDELMRAVKLPGLRYAQVPGSAIDRRFHVSGALEHCAERGVSVFIRSIFLQGVLLLDPNKVPPPLAELRPFLTKFRGLSKELAVAPETLALAAVMGLPAVISAVIGVSSLEELRINTSAALRIRPDITEAVLSLPNETPAALLDPRNWPTL